VLGALPEHLDKCMGSHLLLTLGKIQEQQSVIKQLSDGIKAQEENHKTQMTAFAGLQATVVATEAAIAIAEKRQMNHLQSEISRVNSRIGSEVSSLTSQTSSNVRRLQEQLAEVTKDVAVLKKR
jgi:SMC interacting uncharacterized protein involved in chromosome segregation